MKTKGLERLASPLRIGRMVIKNRIVMPPMNTNFSNENGAVTPQMTEYFARRAKGGAGLIVVEAASIVPYAKNHGVQPMLYDEKFVPEYAKMVEKIHRYGAKASIEIVHYGSEATIPGRKVSSSDVSGLAGVKVEPLTKEEIYEIEDQFAETAYLAKMAGFDAITLHGTHGYLIAQFLSPLYNKRTDEYGECLENRTRFLREIVEKCKQRLGEQYPIMVRLSIDEYIEGGRTIDETIEIAKEIEKMGVAALDLSCCVPSTYIFSIAPGTLPGMKGLQKENAKAIKAAINIPVIVAGGIKDPYMGEEFLEEGVADLIVFGRAQLADPDFANKALSGRVDEIRPCLSCLTCLYSLDDMHCLRCAVNAETGREYDLKVPAEKVENQKMVVIGAGPAGMEAARIAAKRGYQVTLIEKSEKIGGSLFPASVPPGKADMRGLVAWYSNELEKEKVEILLNTEYTEKLAGDLRPDVVINATGAEFSRMIPGSDNSNVITAIEALNHPENVGQNVVIIGGGNTGCETAEFLSDGAREIKINRAKDFSGELEYDVIDVNDKKPKNVTIVEFFPQAGDKLGGMHKPIMDIKLETAGVRVMTSTKVVQIYEDGRVDVEGVTDGKKETLKADTVILAGGMKPVKGYTGTDSVCIGDSKAVGKIETAIYDGYFTAREI
nr:NAD(P)/FAD-dependent oxidoreductase [uncultured Mediterraneibacter sp.]